MQAFVIRPIEPDVTNRVRTSLLAPNYGHPVHRELAHGTGPCRECLSTFMIGSDDRLLFTYNPFDGPTDLPQPGPVFIHADACDPFSGDGYPEGLHSIPVVAEAHHRDGSRSERHTIAHSSAATTLQFLLESLTVRFLHLAWQPGSSLAMP